MSKVQNRARGRPPRSEEAANVRVMLRLTSLEHTAIAAAADSRELTVSEYIRDAALRAARRGA